MTRITSALATVITLLGLSTQAFAVPIQITGSQLDLGAIGIGDYSYSAKSGLIDLAEGDHHPFNFGHVTVIDQEDGCWFFVSFDCAAGGGTVQLSVQLSSPILDGVFGDLALFGIASRHNDGLVWLDWGGPAFIGYSYGGTSGGILALDMADLGSIHDWDHFDDGIDLWGNIYNVKSPVAVPEPGILLLLGSGLLAVAGMRRRKALRT